MPCFSAKPFVLAKQIILQKIKGKNNLQMLFSAESNPCDNQFATFWIPFHLSSCMLFLAKFLMTYTRIATLSPSQRPAHCPRLCRVFFIGKDSLKTKGYHYEYNVGLGKKNQSAVLASLILLAFLFLFHTVLEHIDQRY